MRHREREIERNARRANAYWILCRERTSTEFALFALHPPAAMRVFLNKSDCQMSIWAGISAETAVRQKRVRYRCKWGRGACHRRRRPDR